MEEPLQSRRIAVTGAGGFVGLIAVEALARQGASVQAVVGPPGAPARIPRGAASVAQAEICDAAALAKLFDGAEIVVHLAGTPSVAASFEDPARTMRVHGEGTAAVLQACRAAAVASLVYVSSAEVYGQPRRLPVSEEHPLEPRSPYGAAKIAAEKLIEAWAPAFGMRAVVLRPFSIFGPGASADSVMERIIAQARSGDRILLHDLAPVRDYCFVGDLAAAIGRSCAAEVNGVFNVGTGRGASVAEVAALVLGALNRNCPVLEDGKKRPGEIHRLIADTRRARDVLGWQAAVSLEDGLRRMLS